MIRALNGLLILVLLGATGFVFSSARADDQFKKVTVGGLVGYVIPSAYATANLQDNFGKEVSGFWTPTFEQVRIAQSAVVKTLHGNKENQSSMLQYYPNMSQAEREVFLKNFEDESLPYILTNYNGYTVQFIGVIVDAKKYIQCHYLLRADPKMAANSYFMGPMDGGASAWNIRFDVNSGACINYTDMGSA
jgi:hypothetical protein